MKKFSLLIVLTLCIMLIIGCQETETDTLINTKTEISTLNNTQKETIEIKVEAINYKDYEGNWKLKVNEAETLYLITTLEVYYGITGIAIEKIEDNQVTGKIYSVTGAPSYRNAEVNFEGEIEQGKLIAEYEDDGWLYTGKIELKFENGEILANITRNPVENTPMWGIPEGKFEFVRPIETEIFTQLESEKSHLECFLFPLSKDKINPFNEGELNDDTIINFVGLNIGLGDFDLEQFGERVKEKDGNVAFEKLVMNELANLYFKVEIKEHQISPNIAYENGIYTVPSMGGVSEYPKVQMLLKDVKNEGIYYAIVDYMFEYPEEGEKLEYQYLIKLEHNLKKGKDEKAFRSYTIKELKKVEDPIDFDVLYQFLNNENE